MIKPKKRKLSQNQVDEVLLLLREKIPLRVVAEQFNVSKACVDSIKRNGGYR